MSEFTDNRIGEKAITLVNHGLALSLKADGLPWALIFENAAPMPSRRSRRQRQIVGAVDFCFEGFVAFNQVLSRIQEYLISDNALFVGQEKAGVSCGKCAAQLLFDCSDVFLLGWLIHVEV